MERHADYDEQSEILLFFNEDPEETPPQVQDPTSPLQPPPNPLPTPSQPAPTATANISADQSFWAEVYTLQPPHALMGILTDLHVHRFVLHQHLDSLNALTDTPIGHQPLTDTLPHLSSGSLPFTTTTYNASRTTRAWLSMPLTPWLGFPQQHTSGIPT